jgi:hypothetical protein
MAAAVCLPLFAGEPVQWDGRWRLDIESSQTFDNVMKEMRNKAGRRAGRTRKRGGVPRGGAHMTGDGREAHFRFHDIKDGFGAGDDFLYVMRHPPENLETGLEDGVMTLSGGGHRYVLAVTAEPVAVQDTGLQREIYWENGFLNIVTTTPVNAVLASIGIDPNPDTLTLAFELSDGAMGQRPTVTLIYRRDSGQPPESDPGGHAITLE